MIASVLDYIFHMTAVLPPTRLLLKGILVVVLQLKADLVCLDARVTLHVRYIQGILNLENLRIERGK